MYSIVFDLELVKRFKKGQPSEIVEIGACKVDMTKKIIIDQFQLYVLPKGRYISKSTRKFIHMEKSDLKKAVPFQEAIERFANWMGEEYFLCSWGKDDKAHLIDQCTRNKMSLEWFKNYNDIQKPIGKILGNDSKNQIGLKTAMELAGLTLAGKAHRGIDDAINTGELFILYLDQIELQTNTISMNEIAQYAKKKSSIIPIK